MSDLDEKLKSVFKSILGTEIKLSPQKGNNEEEVFCLLIEKLEESLDFESAADNISGIKLDKITTPLWYVIDNMFAMLYGDDITDIIMWYLLEKENKPTVSTPYGDIEIEINTSKELFKFIKRK